jgi:hypothetical protein
MSNRKEKVARVSAGAKLQTVNENRNIVRAAQGSGFHSVHGSGRHGAVAFTPFDQSSIGKSKTTNGMATRARAKPPPHVFTAYHFVRNWTNRPAIAGPTPRVEPVIEVLVAFSFDYWG